MSQHDYSVADSDGATVRADINDVLAAIVSRNSGTSAPSTTFAYMLWADTTNGVLKRRNAANSAWIVEATIDETLVVARSSDTMLDVSDKGKTIRATSSFTQTFDAAATLGDGWFVDYVNEGTGTITFDPNSAETIDGVTTLAFGPGESGRIVCNGSNLKIVNRSRYAGAIASGRNITARTNATNPNYQIDIDADELQLKDANGNVFVATSVNLTVDITASGANGLDTGAEGGDTWYYGWVIAKPDGTVAGLLSTSSSSPTLPSGYTFKALVTAVRNNGSSNFIPFRQFGNEVFYHSMQNVLSGGNATSSTSASVAAAVPPIATAFQLGGRWSAQCDGSGNLSASLQFEFVSGSLYHQENVIITGVAASASQGGGVGPVVFPNVSQQFYYYWSYTALVSQSVTMEVLSFKLPLGGE